MKKFKQILLYIAATLSIAQCRCNDLPPHPGVLTQINDLGLGTIAVSGQIDPAAVQTPFDPRFAKDSKTTGTVIKYKYSLTLTKANIQNFLPGTIEIQGDWGLDTLPYGFLWPSPGGYAVIIPKRDGKKITDNSVSVIDQNYKYGYSSSSPFSFNVTFDDPNLAAPESHVYTLEFWECVGQCAINDYDVATDKKAELNITFAVVP